MHLQPINQVSSYVQLAPLIGGIRKSTDKLPKNSLPTISNGTLLENAKKAFKNVTYDSYGRMNIIPRSVFLAYA
jgi:hypothetical protein